MVGNFEKKTNFMITIRYKIPKFLLVGTFFEEGGRGYIKFWLEAEILGIFLIEVAPNLTHGQSLNGCDIPLTEL